MTVRSELGEPAAKVLEHARAHLRLRPVDITALRRATSLVFRFDGLRHSIIAVEELDDDEPSFSRDVSVNGRCTSYGPRDSAGARVESACATVPSSSMRREVDTWMRMLRPGDELTLEWIAGNQNGYLNDAGLARDELWLTLVRDPDGRRVPHRFFVDDSITTPYAALRMCQLDG